MLCFFSPYGCRCMHSPRQQGLGLFPCLGQGLVWWQSSADGRQEQPGLNSVPREQHYLAVGRIGPPGPSASPHPCTTCKGEAAAILFQSRTKVSFFLFFLEMRHSDLP